MIKNNILFLFITFFASSCCCKIDKYKQKEQIKEVLFSQQKSWNKGDLLGFMQGYAKSDSLIFIGSKGVKYGWQNTLEDYKKGYPNKEYMGKLHFDIKHINVLSSNTAFLIGSFYLNRNDSLGNASGIFSLLFQKINDKWKIISDHTSSQ